jgi:hypothetical protein
MFSLRYLLATWLKAIFYVVVMIYFKRKLVQFIMSIDMLHIIKHDAIKMVIPLLNTTIDILIVMFPW